MDAQFRGLIDVSSEHYAHEGDGPSRAIHSGIASPHPESSGCPNEERYRALLANIPDVVWTIDSQFRFVFISPNIERISGFSLEDINRQGASLYLDCVHPDDRARVAENLQALFGDGRPYDIECRVRRKSGDWIWVHDRAYSTYEREGVRYADGILTDITTRKQSEQMLRRSEERLRSLIESTRDWVWEVDVHGRYAYCSPRVMNLLGYRPEEVLGRTPFDFMDPEEAQRCRARFASVVKARAPMHNLENSNLHKDGHTVFVETNGLAILGENGVLTGYRGIDRDITERRLAEGELQRAKEAAEAANRAKSEFLANMSHEIRTPLNGILGMVDLTLETELTAPQREHLEIVKVSAESLLSIINDILDFSKIEAGKLDLEPAPFHLRDALAPTIRALTVSAHRKGLQLNYFVAPGIPQVLVGDPGRVRQILLNLVGNAIKFTDCGEVTVRLDKESADFQYLWLRLSVADTGVGIPPDRLTAVFDAFVQADTSTTRRYGGTGLGLTIVRKLTELMAGRITVESTVGVGSTFHCNLRLQVADPRQTAATVAPAPSRIPAAANHQPEAVVPILVAEDNPINQAIAVALLERHGYQVELATTGREAVQRFRGKPVKAILMDVQMPEMDGFEATAAIRELEAHTGTHAPIIAMTAHAMKGDRERCLAAGMDGYISKPVRAQELLALLENLISAD
jgi:PAS domain S-box-containing protein